MKWEFLGKQELKEAEPGGKGYTYLASLWRSAVPGGWILMTLNAKSNEPRPTSSFYPDPEHRWSVAHDPQADILLRPAMGTLPYDAAQSLRAASAPESDEDVPPIIV